MRGEVTVVCLPHSREKEWGSQKGLGLLGQVSIECGSDEVDIVFRYTGKG
jgi:phage tail tube protein FII